jgi:monovalent cation/hydrogen antiporter
MKLRAVRELRTCLLGVWASLLQLAVGAVAFTTLVVGIVAHWVEPSLPWAACFALGAIVSPPDAVGAKAVLQRLSLPPRITVLLEGESLVNDASGLVLYRFAVAAALTGTFDAGQATLSFVGLALGGVAAGVAFGWLVTVVLGHLRDPTLSVIASFLAAWAAYIIGEALHVSGVLATVACGLVMGWRQHTVLSAVTRTQARAVWDVIVFILESLIFILIGLSLRGVLLRLAGAGIRSQAYCRQWEQSLPLLSWCVSSGSSLRPTSLAH